MHNQESSSNLEEDDLSSSNYLVSSEDEELGLEYQSDGDNNLDKVASIAE